MNKKFLLKTWLLLALMVLGVSSAWAEEEELTLNNSTSVSGTYVTFTFAQGSNSNNAPVINSEQVRLYPGNTVTVSSTTKKITQIDLTVAVNANKKGTIPTSVTVSNGSCNDLSSLETSTNSATWTSSTGAGESEIVFTVNGTAGNIHFITAKVYYAGGAPVPVTGITLDDSATVEEGKTITLTPTISPDNATNRTINWASSNDEVATVANGVVTGVKAGKARITATTADGGYSAYCDVTVTKPIVADEVINFSEFGYTNAYALSTVNGTNVTLTFAKNTGSTTPAYYDTGSAARLYGQNSLTISSDYVISKIVLTFDGNNKGTLSANTGSYSDGTWTGNASTIVITNTASSGHARIKTISFYFVKQVVSVTDAGYATLCADKALDFDFTGLDVKAYKAAMVDNNVVTFTPVTKVPAGAGVLLKAEQGEYEVPVIATASALTGNLLVGVSEDGKTVDGSDPKFSYYVLRKQNEKTGFYKIVADGYNLKKGTAYLKVEVAGSNAKTFIGLDGTETAVEAVAAQEQFAGELYNLQGQRVGNDYKGIVIVNGKKVIR